MQDPISNMIIKMKNASMRGISSVEYPHSNLALAISEFLVKHGYLKSTSIKGKKTIKTIESELAYDESKSPKITGVDRVSKVSKRVYAGSKDLKPVRSGYGMTVLTTPIGILSDKEAKEKKVGGELLFKIW